MDGLLHLGIGPFHVFDFTSSTVPENSLRRRPGSHELKVCLAKQGRLRFEIMQPVKGKSLMAGYLDQVSLMIRPPSGRRSGSIYYLLTRCLTGSNLKRRGKEGVHHVPVDCRSMTIGERTRRMKESGFERAMEAVGKGRRWTCHFGFFDTEEIAGTVSESIEFSEDWKDLKFECYPQPLKADDPHHNAEKGSEKQKSHLILAGHL
jgi:methylmalonyl-CoA/ethylmalonyl-CoA epimerase